MYYVPNCPLGHAEALQLTNLLVKEGALRSCAVCGQLVSSCDQQTYNNTMQEFDTPSGTTQTTGAALARGSKVHSQRLNLIKTKLNKPAAQIKLLDLGCSSGAFLEAARSMNFQAEGVEPAAQAAQTAITKGFTVHIGLIEDLNLPANSFDVITLFEVIEHVPEPVQMLNACAALLKPGGLIMIGTGNTNSWTVKTMRTRWDYFDMSKHGGHISFYNKNSMRMLAQLCNLRVVYLRTRALKFFEKNTTSKFIYKLTKLGSELLSLPAKWFNCGHDMLVILQKS